MRILITLVLILTAAAAPSAEAETLAERAASAYQAEDWSAARAAYAELAAETPASGRAWYRLGVAERYVGNLDAAAAALTRAQENGVPASFVEWEVAKIAMARRNTAGAIEHLNAAVAAGFSNAQFLETSEDFESIRDTAEYQEVIATARRAAEPCKYAPHTADFDFWIGEWDVIDASGNPQGSNKITRQENGCMLQENWTSASGGTGMSINYYDPVIGRWIQQWIGAGGSQIHIEGGLENGAMVLTGYLYYVTNGTKSDFRGTWTPLPDGRVRQFFERYDADGKTWQPWFDGYYTRTK